MNKIDLLFKAGEFIASLTGVADPEIGKEAGFHALDQNNAEAVRTLDLQVNETSGNVLDLTGDPTNEIMNILEKYLESLGISRDSLSTIAKMSDSKNFTTSYNTLQKFRALCKKNGIDNTKDQTWILTAEKLLLYGKEFDLIKDQREVFLAIQVFLNNLSKIDFERGNKEVLNNSEQYEDKKNSLKGGTEKEKEIISFYEKQWEASKENFGDSVYKYLIQIQQRRVILKESLKSITDIRNKVSRMANYVGSSLLLKALFEKVFYEVDKYFDFLNNLDKYLYTQYEKIWKNTTGVRSYLESKYKFKFATNFTTSNVLENVKYALSNIHSLEAVVQQKAQNKKMET